MERDTSGVDPKALHLSFSAAADYQACPRLFWWRRIRKLVLVKFELSHFIGKLTHIGIGAVMAGDKKATKKTLVEYADMKKRVKREVDLTPDDESELNETAYVLEGMLAAYKSQYAIKLKDTTVVANENPIVYDLQEGVQIIGYEDNVVRYKKKYLLHELKTSKYITPDYVKSIQTNLQPAIYFYFHNRLYKKNKQKFPLDGILYDVIRKPGIRQKKDETYQQFIERLKEWYSQPGDMNVFHRETLDKPLLTEAETFNTLRRVADQIIEGREIKDPEKQKKYFEMNPAFCHAYGKCDFWQLCHGGGETKENMIKYRQSEMWKDKMTSANRSG